MSVIAAIQELLLNDIWIDDVIDRFNRKYMVTLVLFFLGLITVGQFVRGDEIQCYAPPYLTDMQNEYALSICWTKGLTSIYPKATGDTAKDYIELAMRFQRMLRPEDALPGSDAHDGAYYVGPHHQGESISITYYQWIPLILALMALLLHTPYILWHIFVRGAGLPLKSLVAAAKEASSVQPDGGSRDGYLNDIVYLLSSYLERRRTNRSFRLPLYFCYLLVKFFYLFSVSLCLLLLYAFCGQNIYFSVWTHGFWVGKMLYETRTWHQSPLFPLETQCTFVAERQGAPHTHVMQCALPLNLYNDKIFAIFSILFPLVFIVNLLSLIKWVWSNSYFGRREFVRDHSPIRSDDDGADHHRHHLRLDEDDDQVDDDDYEDDETRLLFETRLADELLGADGCFLLEIIRINVGDFIVDQIITRLAAYFKDREPRMTSTSASFYVGSGLTSNSGVKNVLVDDKKQKPADGVSVAMDTAGGGGGGKTGSGWAETGAASNVDSRGRRLSLKRPRIGGGGGGGSRGGVGGIKRGINKILHKNKKSMV